MTYKGNFVMLILPGNHRVPVYVVYVECTRGHSGPWWFKEKLVADCTRGPWWTMVSMGYKAKLLY